MDTAKSVQAKTDCPGEIVPHPIFEELVLINGELYVKLPISSDNNGYPMTRVRSKTHRCHRLLWEIYNQSPVPKGAVIRHMDGTKDNNSKDNLVVGTTKENCQDTIRHGRTTRGEKNRHVKLTTEQAAEIKARRMNGEMASVLASEFNISQQTVCDIFKGRQWNWLQPQGTEKEQQS